MRAGTRRENIENHLGAIEHLDAQGLLQVADLSRRKIVVEDHRVGIGRADHQLQLLDLALAEIRRLIGRDAFLSEAADDFRPGGFYKPGQLVQDCRGPASRLGSSTPTRMADSLCTPCLRSVSFTMDWTPECCVVESADSA